MFSSIFLSDISFSYKESVITPFETTKGVFFDNQLEKITCIWTCTYKLGFFIYCINNKIQEVIVVTKESALAGAIKDIAYIWNHRKGMEIPAAIQDTIDALWPDNKPFIHVREKQESGWFFAIHLPPGRSYAEVKAKQQYFQDATGGAVQIDKHKKAVYMTVMTEELKTRYPYKWDWSKHENMWLPFPVGYSAGGLQVADLSRGPNLLIAGHPDAGKTVGVRGITTSLLLSRDVYVCVIDLKGLDYGFAEKHAMVVTDEKQAYPLINAIEKQMEKRIALLKKAKCVRVQDYNVKYEEQIPFIVLVIDELTELTDECAQVGLNRLVRLGRAPGICVIAATQRPDADTFKSWSNSKAQFAMTLCFHVRDEINSRIVLGNSKAAEILNTPGRAIWQHDKEIEVQAMDLSMTEAEKLLNGVERSVIHVESPKRLLPR